MNVPWGLTVMGMPDVKIQMVHTPALVSTRTVEMARTVLSQLSAKTLVLQRLATEMETTS